METIIEILGWCLLINFGMLLTVTIIIVTMKDRITKIHQRTFGLSETQLADIYFRNIGVYKILIIFFNLVPYLALKIAGL